MIKPTPNPPETDPVSPYKFPDSRTLNEAAERALDHYLTPQQRIMGSHTQHDPMFLANPAYTNPCWPTPASPSIPPVKCSATSPLYWNPPTAKPRWVSRRW